MREWSGTFHDMADPQWPMRCCVAVGVIAGVFWVFGRGGEVR